MLPTSILALNSRQRDEDDSLNAAAYRKIKERIIALDLPPASLIDEARLAGELGMGLTPVRQALRRLAHDKLVVILPRRGTIVADLHPNDLSKIFEMRIELEALSARRAAERATSEQLVEMALLNDRMIAILRSGDAVTLINIDQQFHVLIARAAHNEFLAETLEWLYGHVLRLWNLALHRVDSLNQAVGEHSAIFEAIQAKDGARAAELMRAHVIHFQQEFSKF